MTGKGSFMGRWERVARIFLVGVLAVFSVGTVTAEPSGALSGVQPGSDTEFDMTYETARITNFGKPDETHWISGNPVGVTAHLSGGPVYLEAPTVTYRNQAGVFSATSGVSITDGTVTVKAHLGSFDVGRKTARFEKDVRWDHANGGWGECDLLTLKLGPGGIEEIQSEGIRKAGRMNIFRDNQWVKTTLEKRDQEGSVQKRESETAPAVKRAVSPLKQ
jgi:hypothetical protein